VGPHASHGGAVGQLWRMPAVVPVVLLLGLHKRCSAGAGWRQCQGRRQQWRWKPQLARAAWHGGNICLWHVPPHFLLPTVLMAPISGFSWRGRACVGHQPTMRMAAWGVWRATAARGGGASVTTVAAGGAECAAQCSLWMPGLAGPWSPPFTVLLGPYLCGC
jgi:hypothetical protein